jgi:hypothetical protein
LGALASGFVLLGLATTPGLGDDPPPGGRLARLFRFGPSADSSAKPASASSNAPAPGVIYATPPSPSTPASTPAEPASPANTPRITALPRTSRPATDADPLVTRISVGKSDGGGQFGMFLEVFADGTVIDGEGIRHISTDALKPLVDALRQGDLYRVKGHCGNPSTDFIVTTHVVVYERSLGKLRATSFSYSGNPHGCDASVHKLHAAIESIQTKLSTPAPASTSTPAAATHPSTGTPVLSLTAPSQ